MNALSESETTAELDDVVSVLLTASRALVAVSARSLADVEDAITLSEFRALVVLEGQGSCRVGSLARRLGVSVAAAERVASRLREGDCIRLGDEDVLRLTDRGDQLVNRVMGHRRRALTEIVGRMETDERELLVDALITFARAAGEPIATTAGPGGHEVRPAT